MTVNNPHILNIVRKIEFHVINPGLDNDLGGAGGVRNRNRPCSCQAHSAWQAWPLGTLGGQPRLCVADPPPSKRPRAPRALEQTVLSRCARGLHLGRSPTHTIVWLLTKSSCRRRWILPV